MNRGESRGPPLGAPDEIAARASEEILGPNPFVGLRPQDIFAAAHQIGAQALRQPTLVLEQEAALARELLSVLSGNAKLDPPQGDKRFTDSAWRDNPFYRMYLQRFPGSGQALSGFVSRSALDAKRQERGGFAVWVGTAALAPPHTLAANTAACRR